MENDESIQNAKELWQPIPGTDGLYEASSLGRVASRRRRGAKGGIIRPAKIYKGTRSDGSRIYRPRVRLQLPGRPVRSRSVADLVLSAHRGPRPSGQEARHWSDDPEDNRLENLYWGTREENLIDAKCNRDRNRVVQLDPSMSVIHRCRHTQEPVLNLLQTSIDGCSCPTYRQDPNRCTDCLLAALGKHPEPSTV